MESRVVSTKRSQQCQTKKDISLFNSNLDSDSLDIDLSLRLPFTLTEEYNDYNIINSPSEFWPTDEFDNIDNKININLQFKCDDCCELFDNNESLQIHNNLNHVNVQEKINNDTLLKCKNCDIVFHDENNLRKHSIIHLNKNKNKTTTNDSKCPDCGKILKTRSMWMHRKIHSDTKRFCCDHCDQKFVQKINYTQHMRLHNNTTEENSTDTYVCSQCDKVFYNFSHLLRHQKYHSSARPFKCEKCEKMYKTERCLKVHSLIHLDQRPFVCSVCNKSFISSSKLKQHLNIHTGERPYKCNYCSRDFTNFPNWLKHTRRRHKVDHKTGESLIKLTSSTIVENDNNIITHNYNNDDNSKIITPAIIKNELDLSSAVSLNSTDDFIMEQALEMEELRDKQFINEDIQSHSYNFNILSSITQTKTDLTTNNQVLPSVETFFASAAFQKVKNKNK